MSSRDLIIKKCLKCGKVIKLFGEEDTNVKCCDSDMKTLLPNSEEASFEKHLPTYEVKEGKLLVKVNHVMEEEHYIEWICIVLPNKEVFTYLKPGNEAIAHCKYVKGSSIYSYCNKHGLWKTEVD